jgi:cytochrome c oxidase subunit III
MSATATVISNPSNSVWGGGVEPMKVSYGKLMMWFFLVSDAFTFSALLVTYGMIRSSFPAYSGEVEAFVFSPNYWPIPEKVFTHFPFTHAHLPLAFVGLMTFILIMSSVTMVLAVEAGHRNDKVQVEKWMLWTIFGGLCFLGSQAWEWSIFIEGINGWYANLKNNPYGPPAFADLFFFITGFHGTHVLSGVILNVVIYYNVVMGTYEKRGHYEMVEKVGLYWHFVDLVWVFVFTFFYLV